MKDLRLFCCGEQTYGSGSKGSEQGARNKMECRVRYLWLQDKHERQAPTRRGILSLVSSMYDPLGFAAPFTLPAKALLQDLCGQNLG